MTWNLAVAALVIVASLVALSVLLASNPKRDRRRAYGDDHPVQEYLLASRTLGRLSVINLLLSSSFGLNALFYQVWLGFTVGWWGLVAQLAWALSFGWLAKYSGRVRSHRSLHHMLGSHFGGVTRIVAGACSVIGIMYLIGWEVEISRTTITDMLRQGDGMAVEHAKTAAGWLVFGIVFTCLIYTVLGGLRGNATADTWLNGLKLFVIGGLTILLLWRLARMSPSLGEAAGTLKRAFFPSIETMRARLGVVGLITNIVFSIVWQFVDTSSWQSVIAGKEGQPGDAARTLRQTGWTVFVAPGIVGTLLGASMVGTEGVTDANVLGRAIDIAPDLGWLLPLAAFAMIVACVLSIIDGLFLATAFTLVIDMFYARRKWERGDGDDEAGERLLLAVRLVVVAIAIVAVWTVPKFLGDLLGLSLFKFVYVIIIPQLALFGPVIMALKWGRSARGPISTSIVGAATIGFGSTIVGQQIPEYWFLADGAGVLTVITSVFLAGVMSKPPSIPVMEAPETTGAA